MVKKSTAFMSAAVFLALFFFCPFPVRAEAGADQPVRIGVLAYRGKDQALRMWSPTAAHLSRHIPGHRFTIVPLDFGEMSPAVDGGFVDFVITNTSQYVELEATHGISRIATMQNRGAQGGMTLFGGVIFRRADRSGIRDLRDLKGRTFMAVEEQSLGGWRAAWRELQAQGIDPFRDLSRLEFGGTHDAVVYAVRDGRVDAGTVRTDTLERMAEDGSISRGDFHVLNPRHVAGFPFALSTRLYPEWPIAKTKAAPDDLAQRVAIALLQLKPSDKASRSARIASWTIPLDYQPVHDLMRELHVGPYAGYGKVSFRELFTQYWRWMALTAFALSAAIATVIQVLRLNRRLHQTQRGLTRAQETLEERVMERTAQLRTVNEDLEREMAERLRSDEEKARLQQQLFQNQKMEAIGLLAGGVAHDFNNILTAIIGYAHLALKRSEQDKASTEYLNNIHTCAARAATLTRGLLAFSRKQVIDPRPVDPDDIVRGMEPLLRRLIGEHIEVRTRLHNAGMSVLADNSQLEQVLMNLVTNARDAMPDGGVLTIETGAAATDAAFLEDHAQAVPGARYASLAVSDSGIGIDAAARGKIFEPFFTTKEVGKGTGLGLAIAFGIVEQHRGWIDLQSAPQQGTTFTIYLPVIEARAAPTPGPAGDFVRGGTETILLAEDDPGVRELAQHVLEKNGYCVIPACNGDEAVLQFRRHAGAIDLLLLDVIMPRKNGKEAYYEIRKDRPEIKTLFMSGYPADIIDDQTLRKGEREYIAKPLLPQELLKKVRHLLDSSR